MTYVYVQLMEVRNLTGRIQTLEGKDGRRKRRWQTQKDRKFSLQDQMESFEQQVALFHILWMPPLKLKNSLL